MRIALIEPKSPGFHVYSRWGLPRLGTVLLGTILKRAGMEVDVYIEQMRGIDFEKLLEADAIGISTITSTAPRAYALADLLRKQGKIVFMGGPHVTFLREEALKHCDYLLCGEADQTILPFVQAMESKRRPDVPGLAYMDGGQLIANEFPEALEDLDSLPFPDFSLIKGPHEFAGDSSVTPMITSRGCPFSCRFCSVTAMFGRKYRFRSVENVIAELEERRPKWAFFYDDNFAANKERAKKLLNEMIRRNLSVRWMSQVRIDVANDEELLGLMRRSNCHYLYIGIESTNPKTLEEFKKGQTPEQIRQSIEKIRSYGLKVHGMFVFGSDSDDVKSIRQTVAFAKKSGLESVQFMILTPLPGTPVYEDLDKCGRLISRDWSLYDAHHVVFQPRNMSFLDLQRETIRAMFRFYSLPRIIGSLNRLDIMTMMVRLYGYLFLRRWRKTNKWFYDRLSEAAQFASREISSGQKKVSQILKNIEQTKFPELEKLIKKKAGHFRSEKK